MLLLFSMLSFLTAFCFMCFQNSSSATRSFVGPLCVVVAILVGWCVWTSWEKPEEEEEQSTLLFVDEEEPVADNFDCKSSLGSEKNEPKPSFLNRFVTLPSLVK